MKIIYEYKNFADMRKKLEELLAYVYHPEDEVEVRLNTNQEGEDQK